MGGHGLQHLAVVDQPLDHVGRRASLNGPGCSAPMPAIRRRRRRTRSTAPTWPRGRPACRSPSTCRPRRAMTATMCSRAARWARSACRSRTWATCGRCSTDPARADEHLDDDQRHGAVAAGALCRGGRGTGRRCRARCRARCRTTSSRNTSRAAPISARRSPVLRLITDVAAYTREAPAEVEPDERLFLPPAGGGRDAGTGTGLRAGHRLRRAGRPEGQGAPEHFPEMVGRISFFVNAGIRFVTEMCKMRAFVDLWDEICRDRYGVTDPKAPPLPLWRAGQLAGPDRTAARKQRLPHPDRDAGGDAVEKGPRPRRAAARLERGAGPAAPLGPAMVAADAADPGL
jgi:hypothetical protein